MMLELAFIALINQCKNPNVETQIIQKIIEVESQNRQLVINVNKVGTFNFKNKQEAITTTQSFINQGYSVDIGLMQFNSQHLKKPLFSHYSIADLFEPCNNIKAGSDIFYLAFEDTNPNLNKNKRLQQALSIYNTGNKQLGLKNGYVAKYFKHKSPLAQEARQSSTKVELIYPNLYKEYQ